jgi:hypothetical protein
MSVDLSAELKAKIQQRLDEAKQMHPASLNSDGTSVAISSGLGYAAFISPSGDLYMETYELDADSDVKIDRSTRAQIEVLVLGAKFLPELRDLLPPRAPEAASCSTCSGGGWWTLALGVRIVCPDCAGLGWLGDFSTLRLGHQG